MFFFCKMIGHILFTYRHYFRSDSSYQQVKCKQCYTPMFCWRIRGETLERSHKNQIRVNPYKRMTPPSTQNLKTLGLRVFFLICCSTFSFLPNVGLRLTLEYLTISPLKWESLLHHIDTIPLERKHSQPRVHYSWSLTCTAVHTLIRDTLAWNLHQEDFRYRVKLYSPKP